MVGGRRDANPVTYAPFGVHETHSGAFDRHAVVSHLEFQSVASPEAKNLEAISKAIDQHNANCPFPAAEVRMNPFEVERLGWDRSAACRSCPTARSAPAASASSAPATSTTTASR